MKRNEYEIKPGADLRKADLQDAIKKMAITNLFCEYRDDLEEI